jgi:hypothetical protein
MDWFLLGKSKPETIDFPIQIGLSGENCPTNPLVEFNFPGAQRRGSKP